MSEPRDMSLPLLQRRIDALRSLKRAGDCQTAAVDALGRGEDELSATFIADAVAHLAEAHRIAWGKA